MKIRLIGLVLGIAVGTLVPDSVIARVLDQAIQTISLTQASTCLVGFDQPTAAGVTLAEVQAYEFKASINNASQVAITATCSGTASPFNCTTPLPAKTVGTWLLNFTSYEVLTDGTRLPSPLSTSLSYRVSNGPLAPVNLRLIIGGAGS